jgi:hypothetical protein
VGDAGIRADLLARADGGLEELVDDLVRVAGLLGQLVEGLDLAQDLGFADYDGVEAGGHAEKMLDGVRAAAGEDVAGGLGAAPDEVGAQEVLRGLGVGGTRVDLQAVAGGEDGRAVKALGAELGQDFRQVLGGDGEALADRDARFPVAQADQNEVGPDGEGAAAFDGF